MNIVEEWKDIKGYEGLYQISNLGRIKSFHWNKEHIVSGKKNDGYIQVVLAKKGEKTIYPFVHDLVFEAFYRKLLPNEQVHHLNQMRDCNVCTNLVAIDKSLHVQNHQKGKHKSEEHKQKIRQIRLGSKASEQTKAKMSASRLGKKRGSYKK